MVEMDDGPGSHAPRNSEEFIQLHTIRATCGGLSSTRGSRDTRESPVCRPDGNDPRGIEIPKPTFPTLIRPAPLSPANIVFMFPSPSFEFVALGAGGSCLYIPRIPSQSV